MIEADEDVLRLDVAMNDAGFVHRRHAFEDGHEQSRGLGRRELPAACIGAQALSLEVLHDEERSSGVLAEVEHTDDSRMIDRTERLCFETEPLARELVGFDEKPLQRDASAGDDVGRAVYRPHAAAAELCLEPVLPSDDRAHGDMRGRSGRHSIVVTASSAKI